MVVIELFLAKRVDYSFNKKKTNSILRCVFVTVILDFFFVEYVNINHEKKN
jgi:hypothetical protein